ARGGPPRPPDRRPRPAARRPGTRAPAASRRAAAPSCPRSALRGPTSTRRAPPRAGPRRRSANAARRASRCADACPPPAACAASSVVPPIAEAPCRFPGPVAVRLPVPVAGGAPGLLLDAGGTDDGVAVERLHHVVERERRDGRGGQRLHLYARHARRLHAGAHSDRAGVVVCALEVD